MCFQNVLNFVVKFSNYGSVYFFKLQIPHISLPYNIRGHPLSAYSKFSEKLTFLTPWYAHVRLRIRRLEMLVFRKILRTYLMDDPLTWYSTKYKILNWIFSQKIFLFHFVSRFCFTFFFALRISGLRHSSNVFEPCWDVFNIDCWEVFVSWEILFEKYLNLYLFSTQHVLPVNRGRCVP